MKLFACTTRVILITLVLMAVLPGTLSLAQESVEGVVLYTANLRAGPGQNYAVREVLPPGLHALVDGRNKDKSWRLIRLQNGKQGWLITKYIQFVAPVALRVGAGHGRNVKRGVNSPGCWQPLSARIRICCR